MIKTQSENSIGYFLQKAIGVSKLYLDDYAQTIKIFNKHAAG